MATTTQTNKNEHDAPTIPGFHAVEESRKWRRESSARLRSMSRQEKISFLNKQLDRFGKNTSSS